MCPASSVASRAGARCSRVAFWTQRLFFSPVSFFFSSFLWFVSGGHAARRVCVWGPPCAYFVIRMSRFSAAASTPGARGSSPICDWTAADAAIGRLPFVSCACFQFAAPCFGRRLVFGRYLSHSSEFADSHVLVEHRSSKRLQSARELYCSNIAITRARTRVSRKLFMFFGMCD